MEYVNVWASVFFFFFFILVVSMFVGQGFFFFFFLILTSDVSVCTCFCCCCFYRFFCLFSFVVVFRFFFFFCVCVCGFLTGHVKVCASVFFFFFFYWWCWSTCNFYFHFSIIPSSTLITSREVWPTARWDFACATVSPHQCSLDLNAYTSGQCGSVPRGEPLRHWGSCTTRQPLDSDPAAAVVVLLNVLGCRGCRLIRTILATSWDQCVSGSMV